MKNSAYLDNYEQLLESGLLKICQGAGLIEGELMRSPDIDERWEDFIKDYTADAVVNFNEYPEAALSWAAFLGMGVARHWDMDWEKFKDAPYTCYYGSKGWDDMDEYVLYDLIGLERESPEAKRISDTLLSCAMAVLGLIQHENIETQTELGFYVLARSYTVLYRIGAAIEMKRAGYKKVLVG